jgi:hypothetical protein
MTVDDSPEKTLAQVTKSELGDSCKCTNDSCVQHDNEWTLVQSKRKKKQQMTRRRREDISRSIKINIRESH